MIEYRISAAIGPFVAAGELAGAVALVGRGGRTHATAVGWRHVGAATPATRDTLFRIASLTKPVTSVLALMLWEAGRFALDEPITRWAPEFAGMRVLRSPEGPLADTVPAVRPITFVDLLTHRAGFTYGDFHRGPIARAYREALGGDIDSTVAPDDWIARLAALPLIDQPGHAFHYGRATDLLDLLLARMEGAPLAEVLRRRVLAPLGMHDTGFTVPLAKQARCAAPHGFDAAGKIAVLPEVPGGHALPARPADMAYVSGGQGLWSTVDDYAAFARLFVESGAVDGVRLLRTDTLRQMATNQLSDNQRASADMFGLPIFAAVHGFGLGVAVVMEPAQADPLRVGGGTGAVGWPGAYGGWWQADPSDGSVRVFLAHSMVELDQLAQGIGLGVWGAIGAFQAIDANP